MNFKIIARQFHEDGFAIASGLFLEREVAEIKKEMEDLIREVSPKLKAGESHYDMKPGNVYYEDTPSMPIKSMFCLDQHRTRFQAVREDERLIRIVRAIFPEGDIIGDGVIFFAKSARHGSVTPPHQDNAFQCWVPPDALIATLALDESTPENGALTCQKGSLKAGLLPHLPSGVLGFSQRLVEPLDTRAYPETQLCMKPGDVSFHHVNTVHGSGANQTDRNRWQLGIGYRSSRAQPDMEARRLYQESLEKLHQKGAK